MANNDIPMMTCTHCGKVIIAEKGYFSGWIGLKRSDFHVECRPILTFAKDHREDTIPKATKNG